MFITLKITFIFIIWFSYISINLFVISWVYLEPTQWPALQRSWIQILYRPDFFQALFHYHASRVYYCEYHVHIHFFICSSHDFRIFTFIYLSLPKFTCDQHNDQLPIGSDSVGRVAVVLQRLWVRILNFFQASFSLLLK